MKAIRYISICISAVAVSGACLQAIEAPADRAGPPQTVDSPPNQVKESVMPTERGFANPAERRNGKIREIKEKETQAYLGVVTRDVPEVLAIQLGLEGHAGVVVESLLEDGPAKNAGLMKNDIIMRAGKRRIANPQDVFAVVGEKKPGDGLALELIRRGKPVNLDVTLGARPDGLPTLGEDPSSFDRFPFAGIPEEMTRRLQGMIEQNVGGLRWNALENFEREMRETGGFENESGIHEKMNRAMDEARAQMKKARERAEAKPPGLRELNFSSMATVRVMDGEGSIEIKSENGGKKLSVMDRKGDLTWSGPWNTEEEKAAAPAEIRKRVESMNIESFDSDKGFRFRLNAPPMEDKEIR